MLMAGCRGPWPSLARGGGATRNILTIMIGPDEEAKQSMDKVKAALGRKWDKSMVGLPPPPKQRCTAVLRSCVVCECQPATLGFRSLAAGRHGVLSGMAGAAGRQTPSQGRMAWRWSAACGARASRSAPEKGRLRVTRDEVCWWCVGVCVDANIGVGAFVSAWGLVVAILPQG